MAYVFRPTLLEPTLLEPNLETRAACMCTAPAGEWTSVGCAPEGRFKSQPVPVQDVQALTRPLSGAPACLTGSSCKFLLQLLGKCESEQNCVQTCAFGSINKHLTCCIEQESKACCIIPCVVGAAPVLALPNHSTCRLLFASFC